MENRVKLTQSSYVKAQKIDLKVLTASGNFCKYGLIDCSALQSVRFNVPYLKGVIL